MLVQLRNESFKQEEIVRFTEEDDIYNPFYIDPESGRITIRCEFVTVDDDGQGESVLMLRDENGEGIWGFDIDLVAAIVPE